MNIRIQTYGSSHHLFLLRTILGSSWQRQREADYVSDLVGTTVYDALEKGFDDLMDLCDVVTDKFTAVRNDFTAKQ